MIHSCFMCNSSDFPLTGFHWATCAQTKVCVCVCVLQRADCLQDIAPPDCYSNFCVGLSWSQQSSYVWVVIRQRVNNWLISIGETESQTASPLFNHWFKPFNRHQSLWWDQDSPHRLWATGKVPLECLGLKFWWLFSTLTMLLYMFPCFHHIVFILSVLFGVFDSIIWLYS